MTGKEVKAEAKKRNLVPMRLNAKPKKGIATQYELWDSTGTSRIYGYGPTWEAAFLMADAELRLEQDEPDSGITIEIHVRERSAC